MVAEPTNPFLRNHAIHCSEPLYLRREPIHKYNPVRMALFYIHRQFICTTFKFDTYNIKTRVLLSLIQLKVMIDLIKMVRITRAIFIWL